jgi:two-component system, sensor histidine kinase and response regulator
MQIADLAIFVAYFSIPVQILVALWKYPRVAHMPPSVYALLVLFAMFIFLCGAGHFMRCMDLGSTPTYGIVNLLTAIVSVATSLFLFPMVPGVLTRLDDSLVRELKKLNEETIESKKKLSTFMAFLCHEVRNPLFAITSSATTLQEDTELTREQEIAVGSIMDSAVLMLRLCNDVLDISKIDAGKLQLEARDFDLHRMLSNLEHSVENQIAIKHGDRVKFHMMVTKDVPQRIRADEVRILQIVYNLLSNAIKFTASGEINLTVQVIVAGEQQQRRELGKVSPPSSSSCRIVGCDEEEDEIKGDEVFSMALLDAAEKGCTSASFCSSSASNATSTTESVMLKITVTDTGKGIGEDRLGTIFEPYSQAKLSDYRKHGGTGLGLAIISGLTNAMGGQIMANSIVNVGSSFTVAIPVRACRDMGRDHSSFSNRDSGAEASERSQRRRRLPKERSCLDPSENSSTSASSSSPYEIPDNIYVSETSMGDTQARLGDISQSALPATGSSNTSTQRSDPSDDIAKIMQFEASSKILLHEISAGLSRGHPETLETLFKVSPDRSRRPHRPQEGADRSEKLPFPLIENCLADFPTLSLADGAAVLQKGASPKPLRASYAPFAFAKLESVVLVVDDNEVNQKILSRMLQHFALEYRIAGNGQEAVDLMLQSRNVHPDRTDLPHYALIFMDLSMPIKDGFEAIAELRDRLRLDTPIVALTANALSQEKDRAAKAGATDFQTKPILRNDLYSLCNKYLL